MMKEKYNWLRTKIKDNSSLKLIDEIEYQRNKAFSGDFEIDNEEYEINIGDYQFILNRCGAYSIIDTYLEVFYDNTHLIHKNFTGKDSKIIIDAGANEGFYIHRLKENNKNLKIFAFEANPDTFKRLNRNILNNNLSNVKTFNYALGKTSGMIEMDIIDQVSSICTGKQDLIPRPWLKKEMIKKICIPSTTLDELVRENKLESIDILKIDVEGMELDVIDGGINTLKITDKIVVEWHSREIRDMLITRLKQYGFKMIYEDDKEFGDLYFKKT